MLFGLKEIISRSEEQVRVDEGLARCFSLMCGPHMVYVNRCAISNATLKANSSLYIFRKVYEGSLNSGDVDNGKRLRL